MKSTPTVSTHLFETLHTYGFLIELELILTELRSFKISHLDIFFLHSRIWSLCNQLLLQFSVDLLKHCILFVDVLKMCM